MTAGVSMGLTSFPTEAPRPRCLLRSSRDCHAASVVAILDLSGARCPTRELANGRSVKHILDVAADRESHPAQRRNSGWPASGLAKAITFTPIGGTRRPAAGDTRLAITGELDLGRRKLCSLAFTDYCGWTPDCGFIVKLKNGQAPEAKADWWTNWSCRKSSLGCAKGVFCGFR
jgi:hypothetical protein